MSVKVIHPFRQLRYLTHRSIRSVVGRADGMHLIRHTGQLCYPEAPFSLHMVTCHSHLDMALWCLKTFTLFAEISPAITIHDDGSLTEQDKRLLQHSLARCRVIDRADADRKLDRALESHPHSRRMRKTPGFYCSLKLFDPWVYSTRDVILLLDSDILFFRRPSELLEHAAKGAACFNSDYQSSYTVGGDEVLRRLGIEVLENVNAGLVVLARRDYDLDLVESYFATFASAIPNLNRHEQTAYAILLSRCGAHRLSEDYQISRQSIGPKTASHHFVNDGSRLQFSTRGVRTLRRRGILDRLRSRGSQTAPHEE
jgi:hypothetical protein